jgi:hypothetical protein
MKMFLSPCDKKNAIGAASSKILLKTIRLFTFDVTKN